VGSSRGTECEANRLPPELWQRRFGSANESDAIELDVTRPEVWRLKLLLGHPGSSRRSTWKVFHTRAISSALAERTHIDPNFRYAVLTGRGPNLCVEKVRAFSRSGQRLEAISVPCEY